MHNINTVLDVSKGLIPKDPNPDIFDIIWGKNLAAKKSGKIVTILGNPLSFVTKKAQTAISTKISMEPIQDLHGYDNPWPAGGGKNKLSDTNWTIGKYYDANGNIVDSVNAMLSDFSNVSNDTVYIFSGTNIHISQAGSTKTYVMIVFFDSSKNFLERYYENQNFDNFLVFTTPQDCAFVRISCGDLGTELQLEKGSVATSYAPYSNICPISGRTQVSLNGCEKNILNNDDIESYDIADAGSRYGVKYTISGTYVLKAFIEPTTNQYVYARIKHSDDTWDNIISIVQGRNIYTRTITVNDGDEMYVYNASSGSSAEATATRFNARQVIITYGTDVPTTYEPYQESNDVTITFPAVYGGTLDVEKGELVVTHEIITYNGSEDWGTNGSNGVYIPINAKYKVTQQVLCSKYNGLPPRSSQAIKSGDICLNVNLTNLLCKDQNAMTEELFKASLQETPMQVIFMLATPYTIFLTPEQVQLLKGHNTIWTDGDNIELTYKK